jgi:DNA-binding beta-propeller fold protein YncE
MWRSLLVILALQASLGLAQTLWIPLASQGSIEALSLATKTPVAQITSPNLNSPEGIAFDRQGNLWVTDEFNSTLLEFTPAELAHSGTLTPAVVLKSDTQGSLSIPSGLAFDAKGDLWVANQFNSTLVEFTPAELAHSGAPTPAVVLGGFQQKTIRLPTDLAFDQQGNLWVVSPEKDEILEFTPAELAHSGTLTPAVVLKSDTQGSLSAPTGLAFDAKGDLWVSNSYGNTIVEFTPAELAHSGAPTPAVVLKDDGKGSLSSPSGLLFDTQGNLWVTNAGNATLVAFRPDQLVSGAPTPATHLAIPGLAASFGFLALH